MKQQPENTKHAPEGIEAPKPDEKDDPQLSAFDFHPIKISGEPLSATIIRERRERPW